ncbi:hypothetical protein ACFLQY_02020 [Verrucomicrobiota bacterium]
MHYWDRFNFKHIAAVITGSIFVLYIGFVIMTPKTEVLQTLYPTRDGGKIARLSKTYYQIAPLLRVDIKAKYRWQTIFIEPSNNKDFVTTWSEKNPELKWDSSGRYLILNLNGSNVWHTAVE